MPFVQCPIDPQSALSEQGQPRWFAKHRPPVQWISGPQSLASLHVRAPVVGHSLAELSATTGGGGVPQATRTTNSVVAAVGMISRVFMRALRCERI
jgi:hypothetical protein